MVLRRIAATAAVLAIGAALCYQRTAAAPPGKNGKQAVPGEETIDTERYAKAQLRLAELTLERALEFNRKVPRTLSAAVVDQFRTDVEFAKLQLERVSKNDTLDSYQDLVARSEVELRAARQKLKAGQHSNQVAAGTLSELDLERLKLNVDVAQYQVERGKALAGAAPAEKLQWELEMLSASLNKLRTQLLIISQNRLSEF